MSKFKPTFKPSPQKAATTATTTDTTNKASVALPPSSSSLTSSSDASTQPDSQSSSQPSSQTTPSRPRFAPSIRSQLAKPAATEEPARNRENVEDIEAAEALLLTLSNGTDENTQPAQTTQASSSQLDQSQDESGKRGDENGRQDGDADGDRDDAEGLEERLIIQRTEEDQFEVLVDDLSKVPKESYEIDYEKACKQEEEMILQSKNAESAKKRERRQSTRKRIQAAQNKDPQEMRIFDHIYSRAVGVPSPSSEDRRNQKRPSSRSSLSSSSSSSTPGSPSLNSSSSSLPSGDSSSSSSQVAFGGRAPAFVPQVRVGEDGDIIMDSSFLTATSSQPGSNAYDDYERVDQRNSRHITNASYSNRKTVERWSPDETELFYKALSSFGTDFEIIARLFPKRDRRQIKNKFKKEERERPYKIEHTLHRRVYDASLISLMSSNRSDSTASSPASSPALTLDV